MTKLTSDGSALLYATLLGGSDEDNVFGLAVDSAGAAYVTGETSSGDFPTTPGAYDTKLGGVGDAFVSKLDPQGHSLVYSTFMGSDRYNDQGLAIAVDAAGCAYVTGDASAGFPTTPGVFDPTAGSAVKAFVAKLNPDGDALLFSTFLGGDSGGQDGFGIAIDSQGTSYVTGFTYAPDFPVTPDAVQLTYGGNYDAFVAKLNRRGSALVYSTYLGGGSWDAGYGVAVNQSGDVFVAGDTISADFPTSGAAFQPAMRGFGDAFVLRLGTPPETAPDYLPVLPQPPSPMRASPSALVTFSVQVGNDGNATAPTTAVLALFNESTPASPFATFPVPPLAPSETSVRFAASWTSPAAPGTIRVVADVDYGDDLREWDEGNNGFTWTVDVVARPVTNLVIGSPKVIAARTYVTSATPLSFSVVEQSGTGIRNTTYRIDGGGRVNYTAGGPFSLAGEGAHRVEWSSTDFAGNVEAVANETIVVDDTPPAIAIDVGAPRYAGTDLFVTSSTPFALSASDGGLDPVGLATLEYRLGGGPWIPYGGEFIVGGPDGPKGVEVRAADLLGNPDADAMSVVLDDTPPVTTTSLQDGTYPPQTTIAFSGTDGGSGVARTEVRVDGGTWTTYAAPLQLSEGHHVIGSRSIDNLNNTETSRVLSVTISSEPAPLPLPELNWKPLVAAVFAALLAIVGAWSSRRVPLPTGSRRALRAFTFTALPFIVAEAGTGVVSFFTGLLAIPPLLGTGTIVDVAILAAGVTIAVLRARPSEAIHPAIAKIR